MIYHLFDAFSLWFFISLAALMIIEIAASENDAWGWAFLWLGIWLALATAFTDFNAFSWVAAHWLLLLVAIIVYAIVGVLYALFRWTLTVRDPAEYGKWSWGPSDPHVLDPRKYEDRIITWMAWWPFSATWWLSRWPRKLFTALFNSLVSTFRRIAESAKA